MDVPRESYARARRRRRMIYLTLALVTLVAVTVGLSRLKPAAPSVDKATVWIDTVKRGPMLLQVRGLGTLVPDEILWIPATTDGRVARLGRQAFHSARGRADGKPGFEEWRGGDESAARTSSGGRHHLHGDARPALHEVRGSDRPPLRRAGRGRK